MPCVETPPTPKTYINPLDRFSVAPLPLAFTVSGNTISQRNPIVAVSFDVTRQLSCPYQKKRFWRSSASVLVLTYRLKLFTPPSRNDASAKPSVGLAPGDATKPV